MAELVLLHHNEPMTTSLAIAACTNNEHDSVILLVRKHINELESFGDLSFQTAKPGISRFETGDQEFEIENCRSEKGRRTEFAFLNEQQATLLITFMRNSEIVVRFKVALVKAFFELRDRTGVGILAEIDAADMVAAMSTTAAKARAAQMEDPLRPMIEEWLAAHPEVIKVRSETLVKAILANVTERQLRGAQMRVAEILRDLGWTHRKLPTGRRENLWVRPLAEAA